MKAIIKIVTLCVSVTSETIIYIYNYFTLTLLFLTRNHDVIYNNNNVQIMHNISYMKSKKVTTLSVRFYVHDNQS